MEDSNDLGNNSQNEDVPIVGAEVSEESKDLANTAPRPSEKKRGDLSFLSDLDSLPGYFGDDYFG